MRTKTQGLPSFSVGKRIVFGNREYSGTRPRGRSRKSGIFRGVARQGLISYIKLCYHNIESCILNNGWASSFFIPERGVRQVCPLSPYIFILCAEMLANQIQENKDIKGITVCGNEIKISQYADNTTMILDGSKKSFTSALLDLELFYVISGLRLNNKKT